MTPCGRSCELIKCCQSCIKIESMAQLETRPLRPIAGTATQQLACSYKSSPQWVLVQNQNGLMALGHNGFLPWLLSNADIFNYPSRNRKRIHHSNMQRIAIIHVKVVSLSAIARIDLPLLQVCKAFGSTNYKYFLCCERRTTRSVPVHPFRQFPLPSKCD